MTKTASCALGAIFLLASAASAQTTICEDFEGGVNPGWTAGPFGAAVTYEVAGGNPNAYLNATDLDNNPEWYSPSSGIYASDWRATGVTKITVDLRDDSTASQHPIWLVLTNAAGDVAYVQNNAGALSPPSGGGWFTYEFDVPSAQTTSPVTPCGVAGDPGNWSYFGGAGTNDDKWNAFMSGGVTQIQFHQANNPVLGFDLFGNVWDYSIDNVCFEIIPPTTKTTICEDFEGGSNPGWTAGPFGAAVTYEAVGGNPNGFLNATDLDNNPEWRSPTTGIYASDWRSQGLSKITVDLKDDSTASQHTIWLLITNAGGDVAYVPSNSGALSPPSGGGWFTYEFDVPSVLTSAPTAICGPGSPGHWSFFGGAGTDDDKWNAFMTGGVTQIQFHQANNPVLGFDLFGNVWDYSIDNVCFEVDAFNETCNGDGGNQMGCTACPCGNNAPIGTIGGCLNSASTSARLAASGSTSVSLPSGISSDLRFGLSGAPANAFCILNSGDNVASQNMASPCFGLNSGVQAMQFDGLRCAIGNTRRHGGRSADAMGEVGVTNDPWGGEGGPGVGIAVAGGGFAAGQTRHFQVINRDDPLASCMRALNTSQAIEVTFTP